MNNKEKIVNKIIKNLIDIHLKEYKDIDLDSFLTGKNSHIDSIDIVGSITFLEEELDKYDISDIDLFDTLFDKEEISFRQLVNLLKDSINIK